MNVGESDCVHVYCMYSVFRVRVRVYISWVLCVGVAVYDVYNQMCFCLFIWNIVVLFGAKGLCVRLCIRICDAAMEGVRVMFYDASVGVCV